MQACRLATHELACRRGDRVLFTGLSVALEPGQALQVRGPNGVGKSSLLRILAGLLAPLAGTIKREGGVALLDEQPALDSHLSLGRALAFWGRLDGPAADPAGLGLADLLDVPVRYLSTGQRKRAAMLRLLGQGAPIWLLDEPLNGFDSSAVAAAEALAAEHCRSGGICVIASHQPFTLAGAQTLDLTALAA